MKNINIDFSSEQSVLESLDNLANKLFDQTLCINNSKYYLMDFEFYVKSRNSNVFKDEYTYSSEAQLKKGNFFFHKSGLDITWGNEDLYVGILIRSVAKLFDSTVPNSEQSTNQAYKIGKYIMGPQMVADELINQINILEGTRIFFEEKHYAGLDADLKFPHISKTKRVGLPPKNFDDSEKFRLLPLRYIAFLPDRIMKEIYPKGNVKDISNILVADLENDLEKLTDLLGYLPNTLRK